MRAVGMALADAGVDVTTLDQIATPNSTLFDLSLFRAINQKPEVSAAIVNNGINQEEGRALVEGVIANLRAQIDAADSHDQNALASWYRESYEKIDKHGIGAKRNEQTTFILEMVANLALNSLTVTIPEDKVGNLRKLLKPFEDRGVSLTAIASHEEKPGVKFYIGLDEKTTADEQKMKELVAGLVEMECVVDLSKLR
ncbi:MAG: hypothetical protein ACHQT7_00685, partial [Candidatus Levyibacteriota bacterium]